MICLTCVNYNKCKNKEGDEPLDFMKKHDRCVSYESSIVGKKVTLNATVLSKCLEPLTIYAINVEGAVPREGYLLDIGFKELWVPKEVLE